MSVYLIIGDINLEHSVKVMADEFVHCKVTIFTFVVNIFLWGAKL